MEGTTVFKHNTPSGNILHGKSTSLPSEGNKGLDFGGPKTVRRGKKKAPTFNVGCLNIQGGYEDKKMEIAEQAAKSHLDILAISEIHMKGQKEETVGDYRVYLSGVSQGRAKWGVGIFIKKELEPLVMASRLVNERILWISLRLSGTIYKFVSVYSPCDGADAGALDNFYTDLLDVVSRKGSEKIIMLGDLNARIGSRIGINNSNYYEVAGKWGELGNQNSNGRRLLDFCQSNGLAITNSFFRHKMIHTITRFDVAQNRGSVIDYVIVEQDIRKLVQDTRAYRGFGINSDHFLVACKLLIEKPVRSQVGVAKIRRIRTDRLKDENIRKNFERKVASKFWSIDRINLRSIEIEWQDFKNSFIKIATESLGTFTCKGARKETSWWSQEIREAVQEKKTIWKQLLQNNRDEIREKYRVIKLKVKRLVKEAKDASWKKFGEDLEQAGQQRNKMFWTKVKKIRNGDKKQTSGSVFDKTGSLVSGQVNILNRWKEYFDELLNVDSIPTEEEVNRGLNGSAADSDISLEEVSFAIRKLKIGKSAGVDEIRSEFLKSSGEAGIMWVHRLVNAAWKSGTVPEDWSSAIIAPIHKKGSTKDCNNYRGISLLSIVGKLYASIIERRVRELVEPLLDENQCGFRPMRGCQDQIFCMRQIIEKSYEKNKDLFMCFVDLEKAYDRVPREKLFSVLSEYNIREELLEAIKGMYKSSRAAVRIDGKLSGWFNVTNGLRQGCSLSPLLFIIFMDKIIKSARLRGNINIGGNVISSLAYADDLVLMANSATDLQDSISDLEQGCIDFGMKISASKTQVMHIGKTRKVINCSLGGNRLEQVREFKYLGCIFSEDAKFDKEFAERKTKGNQVTSQLRSRIFNKKEVSKGTKLLIHKAIFRTTVLYGSESWVDSGYLVYDLEVADMNVARMISGTSRRDQWENRIHNEDIRNELGIDSIDEAARKSRLRWYGQTLRMSNSRMPKKLLSSELEGSRGRGRPRRRFIDSVKADLEVRGLNLTEAGTLASNRREWGTVVRG